MSYNAKKTTGERSTGFIVVVVFHALLFWGLANGLAQNAVKKIDQILETKVVEEEKPIEKEPPPPPPPEQKLPPPDFVPPPSLDFVPDAPAPTAIQNVQKEVPKPVEAPVSAAKVPAKGLSRPEYPSASIRLGEEGVTTLQMYLDETGKVTQANVKESSGSERLDEAGVKWAIRSWKFEPCKQGERPVACWHTIKYRWKIEDAKK